MRAAGFPRDPSRRDPDTSNVGLWRRRNGRGRRRRKRESKPSLPVPPHTDHSIPKVADTGGRDGAWGMGRQERTKAPAAGEPLGWPGPYRPQLWPRDGRMDDEDEEGGSPLKLVTAAAKAGAGGRDGPGLGRTPMGQRVPRARTTCMAWIRRAGRQRLDGKAGLVFFLQGAPPDTIKGRRGKGGGFVGGCGGHGRAWDPDGGVGGP